MLAAVAAGAVCAHAQVVATGVQTSLTGPWTSATAAPIGTAVDPSGNLYVAEYGGEAILRKSAATGAVTTFATACGTRGLNHPGYMVADGSGNLYVSSPTDSAIFVYSTSTGSCTLQYGAGGASPLGLALDANGNLFYTTYLYATGLAVGVYEVPAGSPTGTSGTAVISSGLQNAAGLGFDPVTGDLLVADRAAGVVYRYTKSSSFATSSQTTFASGLNAPSGLAFDTRGDLYIAEAGANTVERYTFASGASSAVQLTPHIRGPEGMTTDAAGDLYLASETGNGVFAVTPRLGAIPVGSASRIASANFLVQAGTTIGSFRLLTQGAANTELSAPASDTNSYLCAVGSYGSATACSVDATLTPAYAGLRAGAVQVLSGSGAPLATAYVQGTGTGPEIAFTPETESSIALASSLATVQAAAEDGAGTLYVAGADANGEPVVVKETASAGGYTASLVASQASGSKLTSVRGVAVDGAGDVFVAGATSGGNGAVLEESPTVSGTYAESVAVSDTGGPSTSAVQFPYGLAVDGAGNVFVAGADDSGEGIVAEESPTASGAYAETILAAESSGSALTLPKGIAVDASGDLFLTNDASGSAIYKETPKATGGYTEAALTPSVTNAVTHTFMGIALDANGDLFVADTANNAIYKETSTGGGYTETQLATGALSGPTGIALDGLANVAIVDAGHARILREDSSDAPALTFAAVPVGTTGPATTVNVTNRGNTSLLFPAPTTGSNPAVTGPFIASSGIASDCPAVTSGGSGGTGAATSSALAPGAACALPISFAPTASGSATGTLALTDTQGNAAAPAYTVQTMALTGNAVNGPAQLLLSDVTPSILAGTGPGTIVASLLNASGTLVTASTATVSLTISGPGNFAATQTTAATAGEASFSFASTAPTVAGIYTVTATSTGVQPATATFLVTAAVAETTALTGLSTTASTGASLGTLTASVVDAYGNTVTSASPKLTASVTAPGGAVTALSGQAQNGVATLNLNSVALNTTGTWSVTVAGTGLVTSGLSIAVTTASTAPGYSLSVTPGSAASAGPLTAGQSATYSLTLAPTGGGYTQPVTLAVTGLPANTTATFSPATVTPGSTAAAITLSVSRAAASARVDRAGPIGPGRDFAPIVLSALVLPFAGRRRRRRVRGALAAFAGVLVLAGLAGMSGCSDGTSPPVPSASTPSPTSYTLTVTATSGSLSQSTALTLLEQ